MKLISTHTRPLLVNIYRVDAEYYVLRNKCIIFRVYGVNSAQRGDVCFARYFFTVAASTKHLPEELGKEQQVT